MINSDYVKCKLSDGALKTHTHTLFLDLEQRQI